MDFLKVTLKSGNTTILITDKMKQEKARLEKNVQALRSLFNGDRGILNWEVTAFLLARYNPRMKDRDYFKDYMVKLTPGTDFVLNEVYDGRSFMSRPVWDMLYNNSVSSNTIPLRRLN